MRGYERVAVSLVVPPVTLRIPMRGYENGIRVTVEPGSQVTNPHEGL